MPPPAHSTYIPRTTHTILFLRFAGIASAILFLGGWGFHAHKSINYYAVFAVPQPLQAFYRKHHEEIRELAVRPDQLRNTNPAEAPRHYIDLEYYLELSGFQTGMPWEAIRKLAGDSVYQWGTLPWTIQHTYTQLVEAFRQQDVPQIIWWSAVLGHYVADAHVPLHTTVNYDGQLTNQHGIHALWESRIPEYFSHQWDSIVGTAQYISSLNDWIWQIILTSHSKVDSVLQTERLAREQFTGNADTTILTTYSERRIPSRAFCAYYDSLMNHLVERRWRKAIHAVASIWYSAWVDAGRPTLPGMPPATPPAHR